MGHTSTRTRMASDRDMVLAETTQEQVEASWAALKLIEPHSPQADSAALSAAETPPSSGQMGPSEGTEKDSFRTDGLAASSPFAVASSKRERTSALPTQHSGHNIADTTSECQRRLPL